MNRAADRPTATAVVAHPAAQRGTLRTARGEALPVRGFPDAEDQGDGIVLVLLAAEIDGEPILTDDELDPATLEYPTARGVLRLQGEGHRLGHSSLVRFEADGEAEIVQRRAFVRVMTPQPVTVSWSQSPHTTYTIDLSGGGMLLSGAPGLIEGDSVAFEVGVEHGGPPIRGVARVVRAHADGRRALAFERIAEADRQRLIRFIFACLRAGRAKTRGDLI